MGDLVAIDVVDRPAGGALRALVALRRLARPPGCRGLVPCATGRLRPSVRPSYTLRRLALVSAWADEDGLERARRGGGPLASLGAGAQEHWHVHGRLARLGGDDDWNGWQPAVDTEAPLRDEEPVLALISGELHTRHVPTFVRNNAGAVRHAEAQPGYLGGLALFSSPRNTTSCSAWRTAADARVFAFRPGGHARAMQADYDGGHHYTQRFLRIAPQLSGGTVDGRDPFAGVLGRVPTLV